MKLTRLERNNIYEAIAVSALDPTECTLEEIDNRCAIRHKSGSRVLISHSISTNGPFYVVSRTVVDGKEYMNEHVPDIDFATRYIREWANDVKLITDAPDLWGEMLRSQEFIGEVQKAATRNTSFTRDEQSKIEAQLQEITKQLKEQFELTHEQIERID